MKTKLTKKAYIKPELKKHEQLREITMASRGRGSCSTCPGPGPASPAG